MAQYIKLYNSDNPEDIMNDIFGEVLAIPYVAVLKYDDGNGEGHYIHELWTSTNSATIVMGLTLNTTPQRGETKKPAPKYYINTMIDKTGNIQDLPLDENNFSSIDSIKANGEIVDNWFWNDGGDVAESGGESVFLTNPLRYFSIQWASRDEILADYGDGGLNLPDHFWWVYWEYQDER